METNWIKVSERLPEPFVTVMLYCDTGEMPLFSSGYINEAKEFSWHSMVCRVSMEIPTHWAKITPPKEQ